MRNGSVGSDADGRKQNRSWGRHAGRVLLRLAAGAVLFAVLLCALGRVLMVNLSPSVPEGVYVAETLPAGRPLRRGQLVQACVPKAKAPLARRREYVRSATPFPAFSLAGCPGGLAPILKFVQGVPGDTVAVRREGVFTDGERVAPAPLARDSEGRWLRPRWGMRVLGPGQYWLGSSYERGFDSRYFGAVSRGRILSGARPLWTTAGVSFPEERNESLGSKGTYLPLAVSIISDNFGSLSQTGGHQHMAGPVSTRGGAPGGSGTLDPDALSDAERRRFRRQLQKLVAGSGKGEDVSLRFAGEGGEEALEIPNGFSEVIAEALAEVAAGRRVHLAASDEELTTQETADFLGVSRPYLVDLLEKGEIPFHKVGTHRRVAFGDAFAYRRKMRASQEEAFEALTRQAQELGMGYEEEEGST